MVFLLILSTIVVLLCASPAIGTYKNYQKARTIGLPIVFSPFHILNPFWALCGARLGPPLMKLPFGLGNFVRYSGFYFFWADRYQMHAQHGPALCIVTPGDISVVIADGAAADDILARRKDFIKCPAMYQPLEMFGPNVDTLNGEAWQRHRRLTSPPFNERNSKFVWKEGLAQANGMLKIWMKEGVQNIPKDTMQLALHVLTAAGFGKSYEYGTGLASVDKGHTLSYRDSLQIIIQNVFATILITSANLPYYVLPRRLKNVKTAITEFREYMVEMVEEEKSSIHEKDTEKDNLMSVLIRASESEAGGRNGLTNEEIYGNLFIYNLAGHDTTAHTLAFAITLMATDPKLQSWIREELNFVFGDKGALQEDDYEKAFPQLNRCMALLHETLRLYGPIIVVPKYVPDHPATITIAGKQYTLPPHTHAPLNVAALNTLPYYWGPDSLTFRPYRWIETSSPNDLSSEKLYVPPQGVFIPFAAGPRVCPGKRFAQVEFIAVISKLFRRHMVKPRLEEGESFEEGRERLFRCVDDSHLVVTLQMRYPERVGLVWEEV